ncbi:hypothetical protein KAR91_27585 [Candidatus Pacearchaeota archaeon]|nr:hypothetical protein [Candidatus Pacearchaeota archaeon]
MPTLFIIFSILAIILIWIVIKALKWVVVKPLIFISLAALAGATYLYYF